MIYKQVQCWHLHENWMRYYVCLYGLLISCFENYIYNYQKVHSWLGYHNRNHDTHLSSVLSPKAKTWQNECFEILNNERWICMFMFSSNKCYNQLFKSIEQILNVLFKYKPKRNVGLLRCSKMTYFNLECQNPTKTSNNVLVFALTFLIFSPNLWNVNL